MFKSKRRKELEAKEDELYRLKRAIQDLKHWCAEDSGEIAFAMLHLEKPRTDINGFREKLRRGEYTFENYRNTFVGK